MPIQLSLQTHQSLDNLHLPQVGEAHLWVVPLDGPESALEAHQECLAPDEVARAERFIRREPRTQFIVARSTLRQLLGAYLSQPPSALRFCYSRYGKPFLEDCPLQFNLAHSGSLAVYAMTVGSDVGIDVEYMRPDRALRDIAARFFAPEEVEALGRLPKGMETEGFYRCWTCKEAIVKAKGDGLMLPLAGFAVDFASMNTITVRRTDWETTEAARWQLQAFSPAPGYAGAVAVLPGSA